MGVIANRGLFLPGMPLSARAWVQSFLTGWRSPLPRLAPGACGNAFPACSSSRHARIHPEQIGTAMNPAIIKAKTAKPLDRRARRTRQAIKESFAALAANRPFPDLTVKEVMERAGVNRATFYAHFSNIEDLERAMETDAAERVMQALVQTVETEKGD